MIRSLPIKLFALFLLLVVQGCGTGGGSPTAQNMPLIPTSTALSPTSTYTFVADADATVRDDDPAKNFGATKKLETDSSPIKNFLLKFNVTGLDGRRVIRATLRLYNINLSAQGGDIYVISGTSWFEREVTWNNAPVTDAAPFVSLGEVTPDNWYEVDLTSLVQADGWLGLRVTSPSENGADYSSREGEHPPELVVVVSNNGEIPLDSLPPTPTIPPSKLTPSPVPTFTPAATATPLAAGMVRFAVIGDYGSGSPAEGDVAALVKSWNPDFIVTAGDNNYPAGNASTIDRNIGQYYSEYIGSYQGTYGSGSGTNRFFPSLGNHDWGTGSIQAYLDYFDLPNNERYYDLVQGPVHLFFLDSDTREPDGVTSDSIQAQWLHDQLAASTSPWNIVVLHHAPFSSGKEHGSNDQLQWPFTEWGADIVLSGHEHDYERLERNGLTYVVNGLGGASLYDFDTAILGSLIRYNEDYGAMLVEASQTQIHFRFFTRANLLIDEFSMDISSRGAINSFTSTPSADATNTPLPVHTLAPGLSSTGFLSPTNNQPADSSGGDHDGYQTDAVNAYADDSSFAVDTDSGTGPSDACANGTKDKHLYYDFNINLPATAVIQGIEVHLDALTDSSLGSPKLCVQLSWDGGVTWTEERSTLTLSMTETIYLLGNPSDTWGRSWFSSDFNNENLRLRIANVSDDPLRDFYLDYVTVNITYQP